MANLFNSPAANNRWWSVKYYYNANCIIYNFKWSSGNCVGCEKRKIL